MADALSVSQLVVRLGARTVLDQVSFSATHGTVTAILGPNASGKTTLLKTIAGLLPHRGQVLIESADCASLSRLERARCMAYVPQRSALDVPLRVDAVVAQGRYPHVRSGALRPLDRRAIRDAMEATDVIALAERSYVELSGGEQRRVLLARALATGAHVLLLDEPAAALDIRHELELYRLMQRLARDARCVVVAMHALDQAALWTDGAVLLDQGKCVAVGPTAEVLSPEAIQRVYGVEMVSEPRMCFHLPSDAAIRVP